jgi:PAS domain S-box-containing protein
VTLRARVALVLGVAFVGLLAAVYLAASHLLLRTFARIESDDMQQRIAAVAEALDRELGALDAEARHWAREDGPSGAELDADPAGNPATRASLVVLVERTGEVRLLAGGDGTPPIQAVAEALHARAANGSALLRHPHTESVVRGIMRLAGGAALVAARPRPNPRAPGAPGGTVVALRLFDDDALDRLAAAARVSLSTRLLSDPALPPDFEAALAEDDGAGRTVVRPLAGGWIAGYRAIADVDGPPLLVLRVDAPRRVFLQGRSSLNYLMVSLFVAALVFAGVAFGVLERLVLRRVDWLSAHVNRIGTSDSTAARLPVGGGDELAALAAKINGMLDALARVQGERGESEARYRAVFDQGGEGIILVDVETGQLLDANRAAQRMLGYSFRELTTLRMQDVVLDSAAVVTGHLAEVRRDRVVYAGDAVLRRKDGTQVVGEVTSTLVTLRGRDVVCSVVRDTGERRRLEEQLRQSQRLEAVGRLASGVAHDFNNLLQSVVSAVGLLRTRGDDAETRARAADTLDAQVASGAVFTRQLSLIARHDPPAEAPLDLNDVVAEMGDFLRRVMRENVRLDVETAPGALPTFGDRSRLEQCLINLVANASDAMPAGGRTTLRTGRDGAAVWFEVSDQGPGIPPALRERVFEPFFTTREGGQHAGLGLTVVQRIVEEHAGRITVTSRPESGTVFRVVLPVRGEEAPAVAEPRLGSGAGAAGGAATVLLVEDGDETRQGLAEMVALLGYGVVAVASAEEALTSAAADTADLLLTDYMLPGASGADLARSLLQRRPELRAVVMSGYAAVDAIPRDEPRVRFLAKPFGMEVLAAELHAARAGVTLGE